LPFKFNSAIGVATTRSLHSTRWYPASLRLMHLRWSTCVRPPWSHKIVWMAHAQNADWNSHTIYSLEKLGHLEYCTRYSLGGGLHLHSYMCCCHWWVMTHNTLFGCAIIIIVLFYLKQFVKKKKKRVCK